MDGVGRSQPNIHTQGAMRAEKSSPTPNGLNEQFRDSYDTYMQAAIYAQIAAYLSSHTAGMQTQSEHEIERLVEQQIGQIKQEQAAHHEDPMHFNPRAIKRRVRRLTRNHPELAQQITDQAKQLQRDSRIYNARASAVYDKTGEKPIKDPDVRHAWIQVTKDVINLKASLIKANALDFKDVMTTAHKIRKHLRG